MALPTKAMVTYAARIEENSSMTLWRIILFPLLLACFFSAYPSYAANTDCPISCSAHSRSQESCQDMIFGMIPTHDNANEIKVCHKHYLVGANIVSKTPNWVAYHLTSAYIPQPDISREKYYCPDPCLNSGQRAEPMDYTGLYPKYNRGHMTPAKDNKWDLDSYQESFYLSNIVPQQPDNNNGIWLQLENDIDVWLKTYGELYIITGPIYDYQGIKHQEIGENKVWAPVALFKIIYAPNQQLVLSFIIPNQPIPASALPRYLTSISTINQWTDLNLFADLPPTLKDSVPTSLWPLQ